MRATPVQTSLTLALPLANPNPDLSPKPNLAQELHRTAALARLS